MLSLALRQVFRHWRVSLGAAIGAAVGVAAVVFMNAVLAGMNRSVISNVIDMNTGAIVVERAGFHEDGNEHLERDLDVALIETLRNVEGVRAVTARIGFDGMLSDGKSSAPVRVNAIAASEYDVCPRRTEIEMDRRVGDAGVLVGKDLATMLEGSALTVFAVRANGRHNAIDVTKEGRIDSPIPFANRRVVTMPLQRAQELLAAEGRATALALAVTEDVDLVRARVAAKLGPGYVAETWAEREPRMARFVRTSELLARVLSLALIVLVLGFVMNATRASVEERRREIGTMLALGVRRSQILQLFLSEATFIAVVAAAVGCLLGLVACAIASKHGIIMRAPGAKPFPIYPHAEPFDFLFASLITIAGSALAAFWPAKSASQLSPNDALRD